MDKEISEVCPNGFAFDIKDPDGNELGIFEDKNEV
ncbi:MAG: VOC family protein [Bacteriovoracaceae bacterium]